MVASRQVAASRRAPPSGPGEAARDPERSTNEVGTPLAGSASLTKAFVPSSCLGGSTPGRRLLRQQVWGQSPGQLS